MRAARRGIDQAAVVLVDLRDKVICTPERVGAMIQTLQEVDRSMTLDDALLGKAGALKLLDRRESLLEITRATPSPLP